MPCFYTPQLDDQTKLLEIDGDEFHHLIHVFRKKTGDEIILTNGKGLLAKAEIVEVTKKKIITAITKTEFKEKSKPSIAMGFSLLRNKNDEIIIEKLTELGVKDFYPLITEFSVRKPSDNTVVKFEKTAIAAIKQCDNAWLPEIHDPLVLQKALLKIVKDGYTPVIASERQLASFIHDLTEDVLQGNICLIIGPEGGFSDAEQECFTQMDFLLISLGNHILRAETAAITAVSQLLAEHLKADKNYY